MSGGGEPDTQTKNGISQILRRQFPDTEIQTEPFSGKQETVVVSPDALHDILKFLKENTECGFDQLLDITAVDYPSRDPRFDVVYVLVNIEHSRRLIVKTRIPDRAAIPTCSDLWHSADWAERECFDMFGIRFDGHPNLKRILNTDDFYGYPLRKTYPVRGEGDPDGMREYKEMGEPA